MNTETSSAKKIKSILAQTKTIAIVGLSPKQDRASYRVAKYLMEAGFNIIPVNPGQKTILDLKCYPNLSAIEEQVDIVNIFRKSDYVSKIVQEAIQCQSKVIWMQQGIINMEAAIEAKEAGMEVIMDKCIKIEHQQLLAGKLTPQRTIFTI